MKNQHIRKLPASSLSIVAAASALCCLAGSQPVQAQSIEERTAEAVVVTASRREQALRTAPATMSVITRQEIESKPYASVTDLLRSIEGVSIVGSNPNDRDISLRGLPGEYTLILVDGRRQNTRETMNRGTGGVQANLLPPLAAVERVEVVRGPMSSLYGADAMGGVVNIITRKLPKQWRGAVTARATRQHEGNQGDSRALDFWVGGPLLDEQLGLQISGTKQHRDEDEIYFPATDTSGANGQREGRLDLKLSSRLGAGQEVSFDIGRESFNYFATPGLSVSPTPAATKELRTRHEREHWGLTHQGRWDWGRSTVSLYGETGRQTQWLASGPSKAEPEVRNATLDGRVMVPWGGDANTLTAGVQLRRERLAGVAAQDAIANYAPNADLLRRQTWALFAENDYVVSPAFTLTTGARLDHDEFYGSHVSPRVYGVYALDDQWTLRGGVASGFKAPTLRQSASSYCMTTGGVPGAKRGTLCGNPALKPETSVAQEIGVRRDAGTAYFSATLFNNAFKNKVASYDTGVADPAAPDRNVYVYDNIGRVSLRGLELAAGGELNPVLRLTGNYTYTDSQRRGSSGETAYNGSSLDGRPLDKTPKHKLYLEAAWKALPALELYTAAQLTSRQYWAAFRNQAVGVRERAGAATYDLGARYEIRRGVDLKVALLNLTNKMVPVDGRARAAGLSGNWMVDEGRRLNLALNAQF